MKKIIVAVSLMTTSVAYAEKVKGVGMQGYFVYQDGNGNKYVTHPTVPSVAYDLNGKKLDTVPNGIKYATVQKDGTIVPMGEHNSDAYAFAWLSGLMLFGFIVWIVLVTLNNKKRFALNLQKTEALARIKENITNESANIFVKFHKNYRYSQIEYFEQNTSGALLASIRDSILNESDFKEVSFDSINSEVQNVYFEQDKYIASVRFICIRNEYANGKNKKIQSNELWTLHLIENKWVIYSIKEMAPTIVTEVQDVIEKFNFKQKEISGSKDQLEL